MGSKSFKLILFFTALFAFNTNANNMAMDTKELLFQNPIIQNVRVPNYGFTDPVNYCQSASNPTFTITFQVSNYANLSPTNQFQLFISNDGFVNPPEGIQISNPTISFVTNNGTTTGTYSATFSFPAQSYGNYRVRVKSTTLSSNATSQVISVYDIIFNAQIPLNVTNGNVIICSGSSFTISILENNNPNPSPLAYPYLTYVWRKQNGSNFDIIPNETGPNLTVSAAGVYYVEVNYGPSCSSSASPNTFAKSVQVTVTVASASDSLQINSLNGETEVCETLGVELYLQDSSGNLVANGSNITWYLNGTVIPNATTNIYTATQGGAYTASLNNGGSTCTISVPPSEAYVLEDITFNATLNVGTPYELELGGNFDAIVTTDAISPSFEWFLNGNVLAETSNTLNINAAGLYTVIVTENSGCVSTIELNLDVIDPSVDEIPNLISPNGDGVNEKFKVPYSLTSSNNLNLEIFNSSGQQVFATENYQNTWPENVDEAFQAKAFFYYKMTKDSQVIKEGILTVIK